MLFVVCAIISLTVIEGVIKVNINMLSSFPSGSTCNSFAYLPMGNPFPNEVTDHICEFQPDFNEICESSLQHPEYGLPIAAHSGARGDNKMNCSSGQPTTLLDTQDTAWQCVISKSHLCDGTSQCLTDECNCRDVDVFYCNDGSGCIVLSNVCDGLQNCKDGSDEYMCSDVIQCEFQKHTYCAPRSTYCLKKDLTYAQCIPPHPVDCSTWPQTLQKNKDSPLKQCLDAFFTNEVEEKIVAFSIENYIAWCHVSCDPEWTHFCNLLKNPQIAGFSINCLNKSSKSSVTQLINNGNGLSQVSIEKVCDGQNDCKGNTDEANCPDRFYCAGKNHRWIKSSQVCDNNKDCPGGEDECQECGDRGGVSNDRQLVQSTGMIIYMIVFAVFIILFNIFAGVEVYRKDPGTTALKVDKILLFTVCFYDTLMGLVLGFIFAMTMIFSGEYCVHDSIWRRSIKCKILGCVFTLSVHGSLATVSLMSLTRCYKCVFGKGVGVKKILMITGSAFIILVLLSILPILPVSDLQDIFRASMKFKGNPFITEYDPEELRRIYKVYKSSDTSDPDTYTMLNRLNNISSKPGMFDPIELGYYSYSPLCIHRIYGVQESLFWYKIGYISCIVLLLIAVSISYILIVCHAFKSSREIQEVANIKPHNNDKDLSAKVMLIIGSQLICWTTVITLMIIYGVSKTSSATDLLYELTAIIFLPLNSCLNPIFYSSLYKLGVAWIKQQFSRV